MDTFLIARVKQYENYAIIKFNAIKCIVLRKREAIRYIYTLDGVKLESVDSRKDLGVTISKTLKPATHIDIITKRHTRK